MEELFLKLKILFSFWDILSNKRATSRYEVKLFEEKLKKYFGTYHAIAVASGTDAIIFSLKALGVKPGDEIIVPALSFFTTAGAVAWVNAVPVFVDIEYGSLNINPELIETRLTSKTKAIIVVHLNGCMADMERISDVARKYRLPVIEDSAQAMGAKFKNYQPGHFSDLACISFNPTKVLSGYGDGGAVVTNQTHLADRISLMRMYGARYREISMHHSIIGVASHLSPFHAAAMNVQLNGIDLTIEKQRRNYFLYSKLLIGVGGLILPQLFDDSKYFINGYRYVIRTEKRDELHKFLLDNKIDSRIEYGVPLPYFGALSYLGYKKGSFPVAEKIAAESLVLPTNQLLAEKEIGRVANLIKDFFIN